MLCTMRLTWEVWCVWETPEDATEPCLGPCRNKQENKTKGPQTTNLRILCTVFMLSYFPLVLWLDEEIALQMTEWQLPFIGYIPLDARH